MKASIARQLAACNRRIKARLAAANRNKYQRAFCGAGPVIGPPGVRYELANKARGIAYGGVGLMLKLAQEVGLVEDPAPRRHGLSQTQYLDRWDTAGVIFQFGYDATPNLKDLAENLPESAWQKLVREPAYQRQGPRRQRPANVKRQVIRNREFLHLELQSEQVAEFDYRPTACRQSYRMIVVRKNISQQKGERRLPESAAA